LPVFCWLLRVFASFSTVLAKYFLPWQNQTPVRALKQAQCASLIVFVTFLKVFFSRGLLFVIKTLIYLDVQELNTILLQHLSTAKHSKKTIQKRLNPAAMQHTG